MARTGMADPPLHVHHEDTFPAGKLIAPHEEPAKRPRTVPVQDLLCQRVPLTHKVGSEEP